jgi:two-component system, NtrC family, response regulator GlrR
MDSPTVLCIDDRPQVLELRKATLESHGYCVKIASSGHTAMKMLEETSVAAVLLEYKTGRHGGGSSSLPYQATVPQPADHPAFSALRDARANPVVG